MKPEIGELFWHRQSCRALVLRAAMTVIRLKIGRALQYSNNVVSPAQTKKVKKTLFYSGLVKKAILIISSGMFISILLALEAIVKQWMESKRDAGGSLPRTWTLFLVSSQPLNISQECPIYKEKKKPWKAKNHWEICCTQGSQQRVFACCPLSPKMRDSTSWQGHAKVQDFKKVNAIRLISLIKHEISDT